MIIRPLFESIFGRGTDSLHNQTNTVVLSISGILTFLIAARLDKKSGIDVYSKSTWKSHFFESQHIVLYLPLRVVGVVLFLTSFLF